MKSALWLCLLVGVAFGNGAYAEPQEAVSSATAVRVLVWVRDAHGVSVPGLTADDFLVSESGLRDEVYAADSYFQSSGPGSPALDQSIQTGVLILLGPMSAEGHSAAYHNLRHLLDGSLTRPWSLALLDDAGNYRNYTRSRQELLDQAHKSQGDFRPHAQASEWYRKAAEAIQELGLLRGRHVIIFVSDPRGATPIPLVSAAVAARAAMYVWRAIGSEVSSPLGSAASEQHPETGAIPFVAGEYAPQELRSVLSNLGYLDSLRLDFGTAAAETGGLEVRDLKDAFARITDDAAGYYVLSFTAHPGECDGAWHPIEIGVRMPHVTVAGPHVYMALSDAMGGPVPPLIRDALRSRSASRVLPMASNGWLFPATSGVHVGVFAIDLDWPQQAGPVPTDRRAHMLVEITDENTQSLAGRWYAELAWPAEGHIHWQREARLYPGSYAMRAVVVDSQSGWVGAEASEFTAGLATSNALRFSALVLATECLSTREAPATGRRDLLDPMQLDDCTLVPMARARFRASDVPRVMIRIYPPDEQLANLILKDWKVTAQVDGADPGVPMEIVAAPVRGLLAMGKLPLTALQLKPGAHVLQIAFSFTNDVHKARPITFRSAFTIEPNY